MLYQLPYLHKMSSGYQITEQSAAYFITLQIVERVDVFTRKQYKDIVIDNLSDTLLGSKNLTLNRQKLLTCLVGKYHR